MTHAPIIDRETIDMLREMDAITEDDLLLELIDDFLAHSQEIMVEIRISAQLPDYRKLAAQVHSLKGASLNIGVLGLFNVCDQIETLARSLVGTGSTQGDNIGDNIAGTSSQAVTVLAVAKQVAALEPTYQATADALTDLRDRTSRGEAIDDLLCV